MIVKVVKGVGGEQFNLVGKEKQWPSRCTEERTLKIRGKRISIGIRTRHLN
jgi:hypothetical protein